ncbi:penicillin acylase family protein [Chromatiaceae bacterium AAb-1]|nr:penicillin acylase family protein [Chromatiaceae bacterium AAb-1]
MNWIKWLVLTLFTLFILAVATLYGALRLSLPDYQGEHTAAVASNTLLQRDQLGYLTVKAADRSDAAYALGYAHAQERFFQMDLSRRNAAGELAELFGSIALPADIRQRQHRFRERARQALEHFTLPELELLSTYTRGVNDGLSSLTLPPFEYWLLQQQPQPWQETDSLLIIYSMYLELQGELGRDEYAMTLLENTLPAEWLTFLQQHSADWQAAIDNSTVQPIPVPDTPYPSVLRALTACHDCLLKDSTDIGSNNFAVSGQLTPHGSAILADDMHLGIRVPGTWYKAQLNWRENSVLHQVTGLSMPGTPAIVVGSNGKIAWGFTNSTADWHDLVKVTLSDDGKRYKTADGWQPLIYHYDSIKVKNGPDHALQLPETQWGPLLKFGNGMSYALHWAGYARTAVNFKLMQLEKVTNVAQALEIGPATGIPAQNLLVADRQGNIGWTIMGQIPRRQLTDWDTAQDWTDNQNYWDGYIDPQQQPKLINPESGRLWTANARTVGGDMYQLLGNGGYDLGARSWQIRDGLFAHDVLDEQLLHKIQLDNRAIMLERWKKLLLSILTPEIIQEHQLQQYRQFIVQSSHAAATDAVGYTLVRTFRETTLQLLFAPLSAYLEQHGSRSLDLKYSLETPGWALLQQRRPDTLPEQFSDWDELLLTALLQSQARLQQHDTPLKQAQWGKQNLANIKHPLSSAIPVLGGWLNMPASELAGDSHMPRVQRPASGQSQRMVVAPGQEQLGILTIPAGQSGHPLSPFYRADHQYWLNEVPLPFLPGERKYQLTLVPRG